MLCTQFQSLHLLSLRLCYFHFIPDLMSKEEQKKSKCLCWFHSFPYIIAIVIYVAIGMTCFSPQSVCHFYREIVGKIERLAMPYLWIDPVIFPHRISLSDDTRKQIERSLDSIRFVGFWANASWKSCRSNVCHIFWREKNAIDCYWLLQSLLYAVDKIFLGILLHKYGCDRVSPNIYIYFCVFLDSSLWCCCFGFWFVVCLVFFRFALWF